MKRTSEGRYAKNVDSRRMPITEGSQRKNRIKCRLLKTLFTVASVMLLIGPEQQVVAGEELELSIRPYLGSLGEVRVLGKTSIKIEGLNWVRYDYRIRNQITVIDAFDVYELLRNLIPGSNVVENCTSCNNAKTKIRDFILDSDTLIANNTLVEEYQKLNIANLLESCDCTNEKSQITALKIHLETAMNRMSNTTGSKLKKSIYCHGGSRKEEWTLLVYDLFPLAVNWEYTQKKTTAIYELPVVTLVCESPVSLSYGIFTTFLGKEEFGYRPIPGTVINTHLLSLWGSQDNMNLHLSFGTLADVIGEQGNDLEFILGPSIQIKKSLWLTCGFHLGQVPDVQSGTESDTTMIEGLDTDPTQKLYKVGVGLGISFKFGPLLSGIGIDKLIN